MYLSFTIHSSSYEQKIVIWPNARVEIAHIQDTNVIGQVIRSCLRPGCGNAVLDNKYEYMIISKLIFCYETYFRSIFFSCCGIANELHLQTTSMPWMGELIQLFGTMQRSPCDSVLLACLMIQKHVQDAPNLNMIHTSRHIVFFKYMPYYSKFYSINVMNVSIPVMDEQRRNIIIKYLNQFVHFNA